MREGHTHFLFVLGGPHQSHRGHHTSIAIVAAATSEHSRSRHTQRGKEEGLSKPRALHANCKATLDVVTVKEGRKVKAVTRKHDHMQGMPEMPSVSEKGSCKTSLEKDGRKG